MIKDIRITSLASAMHEPYSTTRRENAWISVCDPEDEPKLKKLKRRFTENGVRHFIQYFRDWSDEDKEEFIIKRIAIEGPQESHVNNIISFLTELNESDKEYNLGINCMAGISRSTAIGLMALTLKGISIEDALVKVLEIRPIAWPNLRMLKFASSRLNKDIFTHVQEWKNYQIKTGSIFTG
jgi:predicted protein tyrosine phosphatase